MGKGSAYRPVNKAKYDANYERIFGKKDAKDGESKKKSRPSKKGRMGPV